MVDYLIEPTMQTLEAFRELQPTTRFPTAQEIKHMYLQCHRRLMIEFQKEGLPKHRTQQQVGSLFFNARNASMIMAEQNRPILSIGRGK